MKKFLSVLAVAALLGTGLSFAEGTAAPATTPVAKHTGVHKHHRVHKAAKKADATAPVATPVAK